MSENLQNVSCNGCLVVNSTPSFSCPPQLTGGNEGSRSIEDRDSSFEWIYVAGDIHSFT